MTNQTRAEALLIAAHQTKLRMEATTQRTAEHAVRNLLTSASDVEIAIAQAQLATAVAAALETRHTLDLLVEAFGRCPFCMEHRRPNRDHSIECITWMP